MQMITEDFLSVKRLIYVYVFNFLFSLLFAYAFSLKIVQNTPTISTTLI